MQYEYGSTKYILQTKQAVNTKIRTQCRSQQQTRKLVGVKLTMFLHVGDMEQMTDSHSEVRTDWHFSLEGNNTKFTLSSTQTVLFSF